MDYVLSLSYGKDSISCLKCIKTLGLPLTRVVTADIWATDTLMADLPEVVKFKSFIDDYVFTNFGIVVEHLSCSSINGIHKSKVTYEDVFYKVLKKGKRPGTIYGWPKLFGSWCVKLKVNSIPLNDDDVLYLGIAIDETERVERHSKRNNVVLPLVLAGWTENDCYNYCLNNGLLSPAYNVSFRSGCWFCHKQGTEQLRNLYNNYPDLWAKLLEWDNASPVPFRKEGITVADYDKRFFLENLGCLDKDKKFFWSYLNENLQISWF